MTPKTTDDLTHLFDDLVESRKVFETIPVHSFDDDGLIQIHDGWQISICRNMGHDHEALIRLERGRHGIVTFDDREEAERVCDSLNKVIDCAFE